MNEIEFKETFTREQQEALWQYFIDHSQIQKNGFYGIQFYIRDENDFYKRLLARYNGDFLRYTKLEKQHIVDSQTCVVAMSIARRNDKISRKIENGSNYINKFLLFLNRKIRRYLFGK